MFIVTETSYLRGIYDNTCARFQYVCDNSCSVMMTAAK